MARLRDIPYKIEFYWKGERYKQILRPKNVTGKFTVVCVLSKKLDSDWVDMPSGRIVKPCVRIDE